MYKTGSFPSRFRNKKARVQDDLKGLLLNKSD
jgi:hypothetical protein